ncbi:protein PET117 homolog, mitochondrial [Diorhabda carinulata]|uniref:protein PET117 homolog, mitochondrial n=1 Tax=Diorhabda carinulata TaxID=1163345 RepID=UPI0025A26291|nr:protein PET117 homolog, mitochondrial [Diorhabda carinulata]
MLLYVIPLYKEYSLYRHHRQMSNVFLLKFDQLMSLQSKVVLATACVFSASIIGYVHFKQSYDREQMHSGVLRDVETRQRRKQENIYVLQKQIDLAKQLRNEENGKIT